MSDPHDKRDVELTNVSADGATVNGIYYGAELLICSMAQELHGYRARAAASAEQAQWIEDRKDLLDFIEETGRLLNVPEEPWDGRAKRIIDALIAARSSERAPKEIIDPPGAAVEMFRKRYGRLPNRVGDQLDLADRLELAAQACHAAHLLSCEATCREAVVALSATSAHKTCPYCTSDNEAIRSTYYDQTCEGCVKRMGQP